MVRRVSRLCRAQIMGSVAYPPRRRDLPRRESHFLRQRLDLAPRLGEVLVDIRGERLQRGNVDHAHFVRQSAFLDALAKEVVDRCQEGGERLAGARGRRDEGVGAAPDGAPAFGLRLGGGAEAALPPLAQDGMEIGGEQDAIFSRPADKGCQENRGAPSCWTETL